MTKMMIVLAFAMVACGVDQPTDLDGLHADTPVQVVPTGDGLARDAETVHAALPERIEANGQADAEAEPCDRTLECSVGICDMAAHRCIGDESWRDAEDNAHKLDQPEALHDRLPATHVER